MSDIIPDKGLARRIAANYSSAGIKKLERFKTGYHHYVYDCEFDDGRQIVIRMASTGNRESMVGAFICSERLRPLGVPLPEILTKDLKSECPYLILERLPGNDIGQVISGLSRQERNLIARQLKTIQELAGRSEKAQCYGYAANAREAPHKKWIDVLQASLLRSRQRIVEAGVMDEGVIGEIQNIIRNMEGELDVPAVPFLHDITTKNVIVHEGKLSGIVDVDDLCYGDPLYHCALTLMALLKMEAPLDYMQAWLDGVDDNGYRRLALYAAIFCADFMSEYGQVFNGNNSVAESDAEGKLKAIMDFLLSAVMEPGYLRDKIRNA